MTDKEQVSALLTELEALKAKELQKEEELNQLRIKNVEKLAKRRITAKDARKIADESTKALSQIYKLIRDEAEEGNTRLDWNLCYISEQCLENIVKALKEDGFTIEDGFKTKLSKPEVLIIKW